MSGSSNDKEPAKENIVLFPKTVEYYQYELTRLFEAERYSEAASMLRFLLGCRNEDVEAAKEWASLLSWLEMMFPELVHPSLYSEGEQEEDIELTEGELLRGHLQHKHSDSEAYAARLLDSLENADTADKVLLALSQLTYLDSPLISESIIGWLTSRPIHPYIQFRALQALRARGETGTITLQRRGEEVLLQLEDTPSNPEQFPLQIRDIIGRVQEISETNHPALSYFAEETWGEFLACTYGTSQYRQMLRQDPGCVDVWACALHAVLMERLFGGADKQELFEMYGITERLSFQWEQAYRSIHQFAESMLRS